MKKIYLTYEEENQPERNFEIRLKKWGWALARADVYEVIRPERKFFGRYKYLGEYLYEIDDYDSLEEIAKSATAKAMYSQECREKIKKMWNGA